MKKDIVLKIIWDILQLIEEYNQSHLYHSHSCELLRTKYLELEKAINNHTEDLTELVEWNKWFAPRIVYDGIGDKNLLNKIEELGTILNV